MPPHPKEADFTVEYVIHREEQQTTVSETGARSFPLDIQNTAEERVTRFFAGAKAIIFSASIGGSAPARPHTVDYAAAACAMKTTQHTGVG